MDEDNLKHKNHLKGHRSRLKQRFLELSADGLQEYEILELLLTFVLPHRDVKPIAKQLLEKFGSIKKIEGKSLYRFCDITIKNILENQNHFNNCITIHLTTNYSSHKTTIENNDKVINYICWDNKLILNKTKKTSYDTIFYIYQILFANRSSDEKDEAIKYWCQNVTNQTGKEWKYIKVPQVEFHLQNYTSFNQLIIQLEQNNI